MEKFTAWLNGFFEGTGLTVVTAIVILLFGLFIIKIVSRLSKLSLQRTTLERTTVTFIISIIKFLLYLVLFYIVITTILPNISAGLIAILSSMALAIGLALKDSLGNFASGIVIIFNKPFKEGDYVSIGGDEGTIRSISLLHTTLYSGDNKKIVIGNSKVVNSTVINYSARPTRRLDLQFYAAYGSDLNKVKGVISEVVTSNELVLKEPEPLIRLAEYGNSALIFRCRVWVNNADYWTVYYDLLENMYEAFSKNDINVPYNTVDVHISERRLEK